MSTVSSMTSLKTLHLESHVYSPQGDIPLTFYLGSHGQVNRVKPSQTLYRYTQLLSHVQLFGTS